MADLQESTHLTSGILRLQEALRVAVERVTLASAALEQRHKGGEWDESNAAMAEQLRLERELALAKGEETAIAIDFTPLWDVGAPLPHVVSSAGNTFLIYLARTPNEGWDGLSVTVVNPASTQHEMLALVQLTRCYAYTFGGPNDEVFTGHPLYGKGLVPYGAHEVKNSAWVERERKTNSVHPLYSGESWTDLKHYVFLFHDDCFECLARGYSVELLQCSFREAVEIATDRLFR